MKVILHKLAMSLMLCVYSAYADRLCSLWSLLLCSVPHTVRWSARESSKSSGISTVASNSLDTRLVSLITPEGRGSEKLAGRKRGAEIVD